MLTVTDVSTTFVVVIFRVRVSFITSVDGNQSLLQSACKIKHTLSQKMTATVVVKCQLVLTTDQFRMPLSWTTTFHYVNPWFKPFSKIK